jgi:hypothetical protein
VTQYRERAPTNPSVAIMIDALVKPCELSGRAEEAAKWPAAFAGRPVQCRECRPGTEHWMHWRSFGRAVANFGQTGRDFTQSDFNYDGGVNLDDFKLLAARFGCCLTRCQF